MGGRRTVWGRGRATHPRRGIGAICAVAAIALIAWGASGWNVPRGGTSCTAAVDAARPRISHGVHAEVLFAPTAVRLPDRTELVYELHLTSFAREPVTLEGLRIVDAGTGGTLLELCPDELGAVTAVQGAASMGSPAGGAAPNVASGARAVVYLHVPVPPESRPGALRHRIVLGGSANDPPIAVETEPVEVNDRRAPVLGPPLRGGPWVAVYAPGMERGHRRVVYAVEGRARIPGRFAIDWMRPDGVEEPPAPSNDVLAVADAVVVAARNDFPAGASSPTGAAPVLADATGNYVALELGDGTYVFYEHLAPGVLVRPGDRVRRGQVIGRLGATGSVTRPHVHLHVADAQSPLAAEGIPWTLTDVEVLGAYSSIDAFREGGQWSGGGTGSGGSEPFHPAPNMVVRFPDGAEE